MCVGGWTQPEETMTGRERRRLPLTERSAAPHTCSSSVRLEVLSRMPLFAELTSADIRHGSRWCTRMATMPGKWSIEPAMSPTVCL